VGDQVAPGASQGRPQLLTAALLVVWAVPAASRRIGRRANYSVRIDRSARQSDNLADGRPVCGGLDPYEWDLACLAQETSRHPRSGLVPCGFQTRSETVVDRVVGLLGSGSAGFGDARSRPRSVPQQPGSASMAPAPIVVRPGADGRLVVSVPYDPQWVTSQQNDGEGLGSAGAPPSPSS
jgi:hypothetical protein